MSDASGATSAQSGTSRGGVPTLRLMSILALALLLIGAAGGSAFKLLRTAMRQPTSADLGELVCTAYKTQNYDELINAIVVNTPGDTTAHFDSALKTSLTNLDSTEGHVTSCSYQSQQVTPSTQHYFFSIQRTHIVQPITLPMTFLLQSDSSWKISSQQSNFSGTIP